MKKLLFILLLLPIFTSAQFKQGVGFEYYTYNQTRTYNSKYRLVFEKGDYSILYKLQYDHNNFKAESLSSLYMNKGSSYQFEPTHAEFTFSVSYTLVNIKVKAEHQCVHPILTDKDKYRINRTGGHTKIGVYYNFY